MIDRIIGWSYLGSGREKFFRKTKIVCLEAYAHILQQYEKFKQRYRN